MLKDTVGHTTLGEGQQLAAFRRWMRRPGWPKGSGGDEGKV